MPDKHVHAILNPRSVIEYLFYRSTRDLLAYSSGTSNARKSFQDFILTPRADILTRHDILQITKKFFFCCAELKDTLFVLLIKFLYLAEK